MSSWDVSVSIPHHANYLGSLVPETLTWVLDPHVHGVSTHTHWAIFQQPMKRKHFLKVPREHTLSCKPSQGAVALSKRQWGFGKSREAQALDCITSEGKRKTVKILANNHAFCCPCKKKNSLLVWMVGMALFKQIWNVTWTSTLAIFLTSTATVVYKAECLNILCLKHFLGAPPYSIFVC